MGKWRLQRNSAPSAAAVVMIDPGNQTWRMPMARGRARPGAGRKALDQPTEPLLTYSLMLRPSDVGYLNQLGRGNLSLGLRQLIDTARVHLTPISTGSSTTTRQRGYDSTSSLS